MIISWYPVILHLLHCLTTSHHITSHHIASHHITSHHTSSHHITSHHITSHLTTPHHITPHHNTSHRWQSSAMNARRLLRSLVFLLLTSQWTAKTQMRTSPPQSWCKCSQVITPNCFEFSPGNIDKVAFRRRRDTHKSGPSTHNSLLFSFFLFAYQHFAHPPPRMEPQSSRRNDWHDLRRPGGPLYVREARLPYGSQHLQSAFQRSVRPLFLSCAVTRSSVV